MIETKRQEIEEGGKHTAWEAAVLPLNYSRSKVRRLDSCYSFSKIYEALKCFNATGHMDILPRLHGPPVADFATFLATKSNQDGNQGESWR